MGVAAPGVMAAGRGDAESREAFTQSGSLSGGQKTRPRPRGKTHSGLGKRSLAIMKVDRQDDVTGQEGGTRSARKAESSRNRWASRTDTPVRGYRQVFQFYPSYKCSKGGHQSWVAGCQTAAHKHSQQPSKMRKRRQLRHFASENTSRVGKRKMGTIDFGARGEEGKGRRAASLSHNGGAERLAA